MAISFPSSPTINQTYSYENRTYIWTGYAWEFVSNNSDSVNNARAFAMGLLF